MKSQKLFKILFILFLLTASISLFFFIYENKIHRINQDWNIKIEGEIDENISSELGPHGEHVQYLKIKNINKRYIKSLFENHSLSNNDAIYEIKNIINFNLSKSSYDFDSILSNNYHFISLTKDNCKLFLWYSDNTNDTHLLENLE